MTWGLGRVVCAHVREQQGLTAARDTEWGTLQGPLISWGQEGGSVGCGHLSLQRPLENIRPEIPPHFVPRATTPQSRGSGGEPRGAQSKHSLAWLCIRRDKAEQLFGPEPLAQLSAHHAPLPPLPAWGGTHSCRERLGGQRSCHGGHWNSSVPVVFGECCRDWALCALELGLCLQGQLRAAEEEEGKVWPWPLSCELPAARGCGDTNSPEPRLEKRKLWRDLVAPSGTERELTGKLGRDSLSGSVVIGCGVTASN